MEEDILEQLAIVAKALNMKKPLDGRRVLKKNSKAKKWKTRDPVKIKGLVLHQELGWGTVEAVAKYHTSKNSHLRKGGVESIAYTFAIRKNGQIVLCNNLSKATWSQGFKGRPGDENSEFMSVMFEGLFQGEKVDDPSAGEPNHQQLLAGLVLWQICREHWDWNENDLYGHFLFGKPSCPGNTLQTIVEAIRFNANNFSTVKSRQKALKELGFYKGKVDGKWGPVSKGSLMHFQEKKDLSADGVWGPNTEKAIIVALAEKK